jgi:hypothetical protein
MVGIFTLTGVASTAAAQTNIYDWQGEDAPVLIENDSGLIFVGTDRQPRRVYSWDRAEGKNSPAVLMPDMDKDGSYEVLGAGEPTFMLKTNADPMWSRTSGCDQVLAADFAADDKLDVFCLQDGKISVYTYDNQRIFQADMGTGLEFCRAGDLNGDLKMDLECKYDRSDNWLRLDVAASNIVAQSSKETKIREGGNTDIDQASPVGAEILKDGDKNYDFNGDGVAEEGIMADGEALVLQSRSKKKAVARVELGGEPKAALVKDLNGEAPLEIVAVTESDIVVINAKSGEKISTHSADASDYQRYPVAELTNVYAEKFSDTNKAQKVVQDAASDLAECYSDRARGNLFVGTGRVMLKVEKSKKGEVSASREFSAIRDREVESCAMETLEDLDLPKTADGLEEGSAATINIEIKYTFEDRQE